MSLKKYVNWEFEKKKKNKSGKNEKKKKLNYPNK